ncbi:MAG: hypothetical protein INF44_05860, partial [Thalassospira sp.]|nr:hypothetical protein [Thalassospira sp.]
RESLSQTPPAPPLSPPHYAWDAHDRCGRHPSANALNSIASTSFDVGALQSVLFSDTILL